jgi:hypothetical protein
LSAEARFGRGAIGKPLREVGKIDEHAGDLFPLGFRARCGKRKSCRDRLRVANGALKLCPVAIIRPPSCAAASRRA